LNFTKSIIIQKVIQVVLDGIHNMLKMITSEETEGVCGQIEECGGLDKIEWLQNHENLEIYKIAFEIIENFFSDEVSFTNSNYLPTIISNLIFSWFHSRSMKTPTLCQKQQQKELSNSTPTTPPGCRMKAVTTFNLPSTKKNSILARAIRVT
jgi:hypothetical protein